MIHVTNSSHVAGVEYDEGQHHLTVQFKTGVQYVYRNVTPELWQTLRVCIAAGDSVGKWLHTRIKSYPAKYPYARVIYPRGST